MTHRHSPYLRLPDLPVMIQVQSYFPNLFQSGCSFQPDRCWQQLKHFHSGRSVHTLPWHYTWKGMPDNHSGTSGMLLFLPVSDYLKNLPSDFPVSA